MQTNNKYLVAFNLVVCAFFFLIFSNVLKLLDIFSSHAG